MLNEPSICEKEDNEMIDSSSPWMTPVINYLLDEQLLTDKIEAPMLLYAVPRYTIIEGNNQQRPLRSSSARNKLLHNSVKLGMAEAIQQVCRLFQDHKSSSHVTPRKERIITTTPEDWIACFMDITTAPDHAFGAAVFRDCNNRLQTAFSSRLHVTDPTLAEATMLVIAANYAAKNNLHKVLFFCDNSPVVQYFNSSIPDNYHQKLAGAADRFRSNVHPLESFKLCHIPRSQNFCAHNMAKWAKLHNVTGDIDLGAIEVGVFSNEEEWIPGAKGIG
ncbi:hypothetical protein G4B88_018402 [Cannabis sativa]|uniref:RNase H type-1 domain-containing protein n=1 Tax=Cannabis sativa TaxID=3483 RepID=A0A7J6ER38_CANSA|nr:hypothetical protein G4B88_018402 [Cannabis sativa]